MLIVVVPAVIGMSSGSSDFFSGGMIIALVCCLAYLPFLLVFQGILYSYIETAWTLTFMRLTGHTAAVQPPLISNETV
jgi:hypothetical protein